MFYKQENNSLHPIIAILPTRKRFYQLDWEGYNALGNIKNKNTAASI